MNNSQHPWLDFNAQSSSDAIPASTRRAFDSLLSDRSKPRYVLGRNKYALSVAEQLPIDGFIDDYTKETEFFGRPVVKMQNVPKESVVVSCVVDARPVTALDRLASVGLAQVVDYFALLRMAPQRFRPVDYSDNSVQDILENRDRYISLHQRLADDESRSTLECLTQFRLTGQIRYMRGFNVRLERQYFEDFVPFTSAEIFADGGGFDGQTTLQFAQKCPDYKRILYFEPSPDMMAVSRRNLAALSSITFIEKGLFDRSGEVCFDADAGSASRISQSGAGKIDVTQLDDETGEQVSFLKLDVEGAELAALRGAQKHIKNNRPKLAVCVYHNQHDFWRVPEFILSITNSYAVYLRHYTEGILETVMYFIPLTVR